MTAIHSREQIYKWCRHSNFLCISEEPLESKWATPSAVLSVREYAAGKFSFDYKSTEYSK